MLFQADLIIKSAIELGLQDIRDNDWLIEDILADCLTNPYLREKYGQNQIDACKEFFANNQIDVYMGGRNDRSRLPCVTISLGSSNEKPEMKSMADLSSEKVILLPNKINKPVSYIMKPFTAGSYDPTSGLLIVDQTLKNVDIVEPGMILVDPSNGTGYVIQGIDSDGFYLESNLAITNSGIFAVVPQYQYYEARIEHTFFQETYSIGCHAHGDEQTVLWLHSVVLYSLLRYRKTLLEGNGFAESVISSSDLMVDNSYTSEGGERAFARFINLTGQVENSWIAAPKRIIESVALKTPSTNGYTGGIKILSNLDSPAFIDPQDESWYTINEDES